MRGKTYIDVLEAKVKKVRIKFYSYIRIKIGILLHSFHYSIKRSFKPVGESEMTQAVIVKIYQAENSPGLQNTGYVIDEIKTF